MTTEASEARPRPRVLLCEDEGLTIMMLHKALRSNGYQVVGQAANALDAIRIAASAPLDLILMDVNLQGPMNGIEATRRILAEQFVPIVMLTAFIDQDQVQEAFEAGACGYISKPVTSQNLIPMLASILSHTPVAQNAAEARARFDSVSGMKAATAGVAPLDPPLA